MEVVKNSNRRETKEATGTGQISDRDNECAGPRDGCSVNLCAGNAANSRTRLHSHCTSCSGHNSNLHSHSHSHFTLNDEEEMKEGLKELLPPVFGVIGIVFGFLLERMGYSAYRIPFLFAVVFSGYPVLRAGILALLSGRGADINLLTSIAGIGAVILGEWAEGAAVLTLFSLGEYLENKASEKTRRSIREVMDLAPPSARLKKNEKLVQVPAEEVVPGDVVVVFPGERISVDGNVVSGESAVDESAITGESTPIDKVPGSRVFAGSINGEGALEIIATRAFHDTTLARIITMVEEAQSKQAKSQRLVDVFAKYWTPGMLLLSIFVSFIIPLILHQAFRPWIYRGLTILLVSCPCSLVISTPVTVVAAIARAARGGVLIKGGIHLEDLARIRAVAFDKTGTITMGKMVVEDIVVAEGSYQEFVTEEDVLSLAASVESRSEHPLAKAVVEAAQVRGIDFVPAEGFVAVRGKGARAKVRNQEVYVGSHQLFRDVGMSIPKDLLALSDTMRATGKTVVFVGTNAKVHGIIGLQDAVRPEAAKALADLSENGLEIIMLTGDNKKTAQIVAPKVGFVNFQANLLPQDKIRAIDQLKQRFGYVGMVGDGVNDAPSLAEASVGIAMGQGADVALETSDVALITPDLRKVGWAIRLAQSARKLIVQNVAFSVLVKLLAVVMVFGGILPLWLAVLADSGASVIVTLNGLRILGHK